MRNRIAVILICLASLVCGISYLKSQGTNSTAAIQSGGNTRTKTNTLLRPIRQINEYEEIISTVVVTKPWWFEDGIGHTGKVEYAIQPEEIVSRTLKTNIVNAPSQ